MCGAGWYVVETALERWPDLAGYRGLRNPDVHRHFNGTLYLFGTYGVDSDTWGPHEKILEGLGLDYRVIWMGSTDESEALVKSRLDAGLPMLFFLWDPHPLIDQYKLSRIQLPRYQGLDLYLEGKTDFPVDAPEKVYASKLASFAPKVHDFYFRFRIDNAVQRQIMRAVVFQGLSMLQATCAWLRTPSNTDRWRRWLESDFTCPVGHYLANETSCELCPKGSGSLGGSLTKCTQCAAGARFSCMMAQIHRHSCSVSSELSIYVRVGSSGYFQSDEGQFGCISCDNLGDFYQELEGQTSCRACPANMVRYPGGASAANRSSCQCKEGECPSLR
jgi:hypothetical protein